MRHNVPPQIPILRRGHPLAKGLQMCYPLYHSRGGKAALFDLARKQKGSQSGTPPDWELAADFGIWVPHTNPTGGKSLTFPRAQVNWDGEVTLAFWFKLFAMPTEDTPLIDTQWGNDSAGGFQIYINGAGAALINFSGDAGGRDQVNSSAFLTTGLWYLYIMSVNDFLNSQHVYANNILRASRTDTGRGTTNGTANTANFHIMHNKDGNRWINAQTFNWMIWDRNLAPVERDWLFEDPFDVYRVPKKYWMLGKTVGATLNLQSLPAVSTPVPTITRVSLFKRTLSVVATQIPTITDIVKYFRSLSVIATQIATLTIRKTYAKALSVISTATATMLDVVKYLRSLSVIAYGMTRNALVFPGTGNNNVVVTHNSTINVGNNDSYAVMIEFKSNVKADQSLTEKWSTQAGKYAWAMRGPQLSTGLVTFNLYDGVANPGANSQIDLADNAWHRFIGVRDYAADLIRTYVDGIARGTATDTTTGDVSTTNNIVIGARATGTAFNFNGRIKRFVVFSGLLTQSMATALEAGTMPNLPVLCDLKFGEGAGSVLHDASGLGNNGAITGTTWESWEMTQVLYKRALAVISTATATLADLVKYFRSLSVIATGTATLNAGKLFLKSLSVISTGIATMLAGRLSLRSLSVIATGTPTLAIRKLYARILSVVATQIATIARLGLYKRTLSVISTPIPTLTRVAKYFRTLSVISTAIATRASVAKYGKILTTIATGTGTISRRALFKRTLSAVSTAVATIGTLFIEFFVDRIARPVLTLLGLYGRTEIKQEKRNLILMQTQRAVELTHDPKGIKTMPTIKVVRGDKLVDLPFTLKNASGAVVNLTGATLLFKAQKMGRKEQKFSGAMTLVDAVNGSCKYTIQETDFDEAGKYQAEIQITFPSGQVETYPGIVVDVAEDIVINN